jgi:hypothetical protein
MAITPEPLVGRDVNLHIEISALHAEPNTVFTVTLPAEIALVEGDLTWQGELVADQPLSLDLTIRVTTEGEWPIDAYVFSSDTPGSRFGVGADKALYVRSSTTSAKVIEDTDRPQTSAPVIQYGPNTPRPPTPTAP